MIVEGPTIVPSIIQNRRGKRQNLPQPLLPGQIGLCVDTNEVFIGSDPDDASSVTQPIINVYSAYIGGSINGVSPNDAEFADLSYLGVTNKILQEYIIQVDLDSPSDVSDYDLFLSFNDLTGATTDVVKIVVNHYDSQGDIEFTRVYLTSTSAPSIPSVDNGGTLQYVGDTVSFTGARVDLSEYSVGGRSYTTEDSFAIATLMNYVFDNSGEFITAIGHGTGLVTVGQNIQIYTEGSELPSNKMASIQRNLENTTDSSTGLWFSVFEDDVFELKYSVRSENYLRKGTLHVTIVGIEVMITDDYQEVTTDQMSTLPEINFWSTTIGDLNDEVLEIRYDASGIEDPTKLTTNTLRWNSF